MKWVPACSNRLGEPIPPVRDDNAFATTSNHHKQERSSTSAGGLAARVLRVCWAAWTETELLMPHDPVQFAEYFRLALLAGRVTNADIVRWADEIIAASSTPDPRIIEVSLGSRLDSSAMGRLLASLSGPGQSRAAAFRFLTELRNDHRSGAVSGQQIARTVEALGEFLMLSEPLASEMMGLDDGFVLAIAGTYGTLDEADRHLQLFLDAAIANVSTEA
jgi:hypothetical protein